MAGPLTRTMWILAQDASVRTPAGRILTARVTVPYEDLADGPIGHRVQVVDYDASTQTRYRPAKVEPGDFPSKPSTNAAILDDPAFHAYNVYALVMRTLARFEHALGRRVSWGFPAHQLKVVPHAFEEANAFYSREAEALLFGYYDGPDGRVFTCLSHDIVVHETTHALLDGLRSRFMAPSSPDQAAFHEAFADVVALLSVFSLDDVLAFLIDREPRDDSVPAGLIAKSKVTPDAAQAESCCSGWPRRWASGDLARVNALRRSVELEPKTAAGPEFLEPHRRGEILVAAVMRAFVDVWTARLNSPESRRMPYLAIDRVAEEGAAIADALLTMAIRALDYTPPIHIDFADYLSALLTADTEIRPSDRRYELREPAARLVQGVRDRARRRRPPTGCGRAPRPRSATRACASAASRPTRSRCSG